MRFSDRTAIITGAASGIGATYACALVSAGANVLIADVLESAGEALAQDLTAQGSGKAAFVRTDVTSERDTAHMVQVALETFGSLDILVNNAAVYADLDKKKRFDEISSAEWDKVMAVNVKGVWLCAKAVAPHMEQRGYGKIINIASVVSDLGSAGFVHYVASKAAVAGLTRALARELGGSNITVNAISPGLVSNESSQKINNEGYFEDVIKGRSIKRALAPQDLVGALLFLASSESDFITGQTYVVDGGAVMH